MHSRENIVKTIIRWLSVCIIAYIIYKLFNYMDSIVPLAGDDWGYAYNGNLGNALQLAFNQYFAWSGRFFAELWGYFMAPRKELWNIVNPLLFVAIFLMSMSLSYNKKDLWILRAVIFFVLCISVSNKLRIQTYTWIMGSTYVTSLLGLLIFIWSIKTLVLDHNLKVIPLTILACISAIFTTLSMENSAAVTLLAAILVTIYAYFNNRPVFKNMIVILIVSLIGVLLIKFSPGAMYRLTVDNAQFNALPIYQKIGANWANFLYYTFIANPYVMVMLQFILMVLSIKRSYKDKYYIGFILVYLLGITISSASLVYDKANINFLKIFFDVYYSRSAIIIVSIFCLLFIGCSIYLFFHLSNSKVGWFATLLLVIGGSSNLVMLISPIFDIRSSIFTVYICIILCMILCSEIENKLVLLAIFIVSIVLSNNKYKFLKDNYLNIDGLTKLREVQIAYYQGHQDDLEVWITAYPDDALHSADIWDETDTYHIETFKQYYGINPKATIHFGNYNNNQ